MANTFKLKQANVGVTTTNVYVVPSATTTVVIGDSCKHLGSSINVGIGINRGSWMMLSWWVFQYLKVHHLNYGGNNCIRNHGHGCSRKWC